MGYLNRVWMAATVSVVQGPTDQGYKMKSGLSSLQFHHGKKRLFSSPDSTDLRPLSGMIGSDISGAKMKIEYRDRVTRVET
ncbi:hypothetical protein JRO89_XS01G0163400 [Xanthoceras sorbifolium]|uniref:Uncharacterized protein n=1 Tax=Xanthoceras sorbifolium TaxID=99658 RepID=A0ABQ8IJJ9_9ROSI|nr:hypothetical protein JRO89_XS01G0163400 [Xanthoceras sorbifolium]